MDDIQHFDFSSYGIKVGIFWAFHKFHNNLLNN